jgi:hypothetical protein
MFPKLSSCRAGKRSASRLSHWRFQGGAGVRDPVARASSPWGPPFPKNPLALAAHHGFHLNVVLFQPLPQGNPAYPQKFCGLGLFSLSRPKGMYQFLPAYPLGPGGFRPAHPEAYGCFCLAQICRYLPTSSKSNLFLILARYIAVSGYQCFQQRSTVVCPYGPYLLSGPTLPVGACRGS